MVLADIRSRIERLDQLAQGLSKEIELWQGCEDLLLWPKLLERCTPDAALVHRMEEQHERVEHHTERLHTALGRWEAEARPAVTEEVVRAPSTRETFR